MPASPKSFTLTIPPRCRHCDAHGSVKLLTKTTASEITFRWLCTTCDRGWSVAEADDHNVLMPQPSIG